MDAVVYRLMVYARIGAPLVFEDADRYAVLDALAAAFDERLLAYCLLDERMDIIAEGSERELRTRMDRAMRAYLHERQRRAAPGDPGFPVRVEAVRVPDSLGLALAINEVHELPLSYGWS